MLITEMIAALQALKAEHGDLPVYADHEADGMEISQSGLVDKKYIFIRGVWSREQIEKLRSQDNK